MYYTLLFYVYDLETSTLPNHTLIDVSFTIKKVIIKRKNSIFVVRNLTNSVVVLFATLIANVRSSFHNTIFLATDFPFV